MNGDAAVLWSSDKLTTKAIVNGGLRQIDQFGQKKAMEGNYKLDIKTEAGRGEIRKSDVFKIKHENVITNLKTNDKVITNDVRVNNLPVGKGADINYTVKTVTAQDGGLGKFIVTDKFGTKALSAGVVMGDDLISAAGGAASILAEITDVNTATQRVTYKFKMELLSVGGTNYSYEETHTLGLSTLGNARLFSSVFAVSAGLTFSDSAATEIVASAYKVGDKVAVNALYSGAAGGYVAVGNGNATVNTATIFQLATNGLAGKTVTFKNFYIDNDTGAATVGSVTMTFKDELPTDLQTLASFTTTKVGDIAKADIKLRDLDKFWDAQGRFMLNDPQTITITQGDGKTAKVTLYGYDTLGDVAKKLNAAIANDLGQADYVQNKVPASGDPAHFVSYVESPTGNIESVKGTFVIRTAIPGTAGRISLAGDEDLIKAFSLNQLQEAKDSSYTVKISNAHTNETLNEATVTGNRMIGVINPNIDVEFDAMAGLKAVWDDTAKTYSYTASDYSTILHLADNTTVFQIGANEGEDMGVNLGDMRAHALGLNSVLVTDRESAARSITIIDNAIDKVSTQRAKLGAYQNRLEHTISNLTVAGENLTAAESRIRDTDMAKEMMNFTKLNIMLQAGNAMLAQANQNSSTVLGLLQ